jgi:hypothetical protein
MKMGEWTLKLALFEETEILGETFSLCAYEATHPENGLAFGSCASRRRDPTPLAKYEMIERMTIVSQSEALKPGMSRSNGVAFHNDLALAQKAAMVELVERDAVLRCWLGQAGAKIDYKAMGDWLTSFAAPSVWEERYRLVVAQIESQVPNMKVSFACGFPRDPKTPIFYGFGCSEGSTIEATNKAIAEAEQRLAFLWDQEIPEQSPEISGTPDFHQEFYLNPANHKHLMQWLIRARRVGKAVDPKHWSPDQLEFHDLPLPGPEAGAVVRATHPGLLPLMFGNAYSVDGIPHPVC